MSRVVFGLCIGLLLVWPPESHGQARSGVIGDLVADLASLESKIVGLAKTIPESAYDWRPSEGVRSIREVLVHVAGDNYFAAAKIGGISSPATGIVGKTYNEARTYEKREMTRPQVIAALEESFTLKAKALNETPDASLEMASDYWPNRKATVRTAWMGAMTHLHEHLGQLIAYARSNKVAPPWSK